MSSMDKMWASFVAMGFMLAAVLLVTFARTKTTGVVRFLISLLAFLLLIPALVYGLLSMF